MFSLFKKQPNSIDKKTVKKVAANLIAANGATTTLEVKNNLRSNHFIAYQSEVSSLLDEIAMDEGWSFFWNGRFRVYFVPQAQDFVSLLGVPAFSQN